MSKTPDEMVASLSKTLKIDQSSIKRAYEGDAQGLAQIFNQVTRSKKLLNMGAVGLSGLGVVTVAAILTVPGAILLTAPTMLFGARGVHKNKKNIEAARQTVLARIGKTGP